MFLIHATQAAESIRVPTNDERVAAWAAKYFGAGYHRRPSKPRIRATSDPTTHALPPERAPASDSP
ncbi:hypothetical protein ACFCQI_01790 [Rhodanobacter sp. FW102-FHT14D06]|uniref:Uncharacterized protein n=2 Tax=unclassified Rhodanobacter TaxID=2621553 RepID=A0AB74UQU1_9GAMM